VKFRPVILIIEQSVAISAAKAE